jgi:hypothetical protein
MPKDKMIFYCGDTALREAASYLAGVTAHFSIPFDYLASNQRIDDKFLLSKAELVGLYQRKK